MKKLFKYTYILPMYLFIYWVIKYRKQNKFNQNTI